MKKNVIFKSIFFLICCLSIFMILGGIAFNLDVRPTKSVPKQNIPKQSEHKEPLGIFITDENLDGAVVAFLDFNAQNTQIILLPNKDKISSVAYTVNRKIKITRHALKEIIDFVGGITLEVSGSKLRYTGTQVCELIYSNSDFSLNEIILQIFHAISVKSDKDFFLFLINHTDSDLSYIDFYNCHDVLSPTLLNSIVTEQE